MHVGNTNFPRRCIVTGRSCCLLGLIDSTAPKYTVNTAGPPAAAVSHIINRFLNQGACLGVRKLIQTCCGGRSVPSGGGGDPQLVHLLVAIWETPLRLSEEESPLRCQALSEALMVPLFSGALVFAEALDSLVQLFYCRGRLGFSWFGGIVTHVAVFLPSLLSCLYFSM